MNENKNTTYQHIRDTVKTVLRVNLQLQTPTLKERKKKKGREGRREKESDFKEISRKLFKYFNLKIKTKQKHCLEGSLWY